MTKAKAATSIEIGGSKVEIDPTVEYRLTLGSAISIGSHKMRPSDRNIKMLGENLLAVAKVYPGAIVDVVAD